MSDRHFSYDKIREYLATESHWSDRDEMAILEPFSYVTSIPGKEIRSQLIAAFNVWLNVPSEKLNIISKIVNMLHNASLLIDDIEDNSELRRGQPVAHKIYGVPQTINTANYVFFLAYKELLKLRDQASHPLPDIDAIVTEELLSLHRGQGLEILWRDSLNCPSEVDYIAMVNNKTGGLLRIGIKLMMACSTNYVGIDYVPLVNMIGIFFQIRDDFMNLQSTEYSRNKGFAEDLTEGKFSFPIVHGVHSDPFNRQILNVLQKRPTNPELKLHIIEYLRNETKSFSYTVSVLDNLEAQTRQEIARLGGNQTLEKIMDLLHVDPSKFT